jgi:CHAT domain-containing protein
VLLFATALSCNRTAPISPRETYQDAWLKLKRGDFNDALAIANAELRHYSTPDTEWHWRFTVLEGEILARQRLMKECLELLAPDLPGYLSKSDIAVWRKLTQGYANGFLGNLDESDKLFAEAEELAKEKHPELLGEIALRKGTVALFVREDGKTAETLFQHALEIGRHQKDPFLESNALGSLGLVATGREHYDEAIDRFGAALQLSQSVGAGSAAVKTRGNLGWSYFELGDLQNARSLFQQAEESSKDRGMVVDRLYWQTNIGVVDYYLRDYENAGRESDAALEMARTMGEKKSIVECLNNLSYVSVAKGDLDRAEKYNREALEVSRSASNRSGEVSSQLIAGRTELARGRYRQAERALERVIRDPAADTATRWEAEASLAKVFAGEALPARAEREYQRSINTIEAARRSVDQEELRLTFLSSAVEFYEDYVDYLAAHAKPVDALRVAELSRARTLAEGLASTTQATSISVSTRSGHPQQIAQKLRASLLFYWIGQKNSYLWVITPAKTTYFKLPRASDIEPLVKTYREALPNVEDAQDTAASDGKKLYAMLVEPAKKLLTPGSRVILLPGESLYGLNFETLIVPDPKPHFWIEDVTLSTANSLTLLDASIQRPAITGKNLLLVGNAVPTPGFPALPQAPVEIQKVGHYFSDQNRKVLESKQATATAYLSSNPEQYAYLHFVTHGTASHTRPLESAVILSPEGDSYKLYARDIVQHRLNANLVTISACNGSGTRAYSGEGLVGLSWAFLRAGAHNVIGALWEVSDASTPELMDAFYRELFQGKDTATALRDAKLGLLHTSDPDSVFRRPFYWAPFQLYAGS